MKSRLIFTIATAILLVFSAVLTAAENFNTSNQDSKDLIGKPAPEFDLPGVGGMDRSPSDFRGKYVVLEWVDFECGKVRDYYDQETISKLQAEFKNDGVVWLSICSSKDNQKFNTKTKLLQCLAELKSRATDFLCDKSGKTAAMYKVDVAPYVFLIDPDGRIVYAGGIDNGDKASNYLRMAYEASVSGKKVEHEFTQTLGCLINN